MKKSVCVLTAALVAAGVLTACGGKTEAPSEPATTAATEASSKDDAKTEAESDTEAASKDLVKVVVGATPAPHAEILEAAKELMKAKGYDLVIQEYTDYVQPNIALDTGDLDANYFQHVQYLDTFNVEHGTKLVSASSIHYEPFGIYAGKSTSLDALAEGAKVAVPNDTSNEARALLLLEAQGLIKLKEGAGLEATKKDIEVNDKKLDIIEIEAAQIPRSLQDVDVAVINGNYAIQAGLAVSDALATEDSQSIAATTYANVIAVKEGNEGQDGIKALVEVLTSDEIKSFIDEKYAGAVVPLF